MPLVTLVQKDRRTSLLPFAINEISPLPLTDMPQEIKMTLAAPNWYHLRYKEGKAYPKDVYASDEEYFADIAEAYRTELKILYDAGLRNAQVDDPNVSLSID